jgi:hypothetical protein
MTTDAERESYNFITLTNEIHMSSRGLSCGEHDTAAEVTWFLPAVSSSCSQHETADVSGKNELYSDADSEWIVLTDTDELVYNVATGKTTISRKFNQELSALKAFEPYNAKRRVSGEGSDFDAYPGYASAEVMAFTDGRAFGTPFCF